MPRQRGRGQGADRGASGGRRPEALTTGRRPRRVVRPARRTGRTAPASTPAAPSSASAAICALAERREVARELHVLFELRDRVAADDDGADRAARACSTSPRACARVPGRSAMTTPSQECCWRSSGGGVHDERMRPRPVIFMPMMPICCSTANGSSSVAEAVVVRVGGVERQQDGRRTGAGGCASISASGRWWPVRPRNRTIFCSAPRAAPPSRRPWRRSRRRPPACRRRAAATGRGDRCSAACSDCSIMRSEPSRVRSFVLLARKTSLRRRFITWPM